VTCAKHRISCPRQESILAAPNAAHIRAFKFTPPTGRPVAYWRTFVRTPAMAGEPPSPLAADSDLNDEINFERGPKWKIRGDQGAAGVKAALALQAASRPNAPPKPKCSQDPKDPRGTCSRRRQ
jgi:hypothetical protein